MTGGSPQLRTKRWARSKGRPSCCSSTTTCGSHPMPSRRWSRRPSGPTPAWWEPSWWTGTTRPCCGRSDWQSTSSDRRPRWWTPASSTSRSTTAPATCSPSRRRACSCAPTCSGSSAGSPRRSRSSARTSTCAGGPIRRERRCSSVPARPSRTASASRSDATWRTAHGSRRATKRAWCSPTRSCAAGGGRCRWASCSGSSTSSARRCWPGSVTPATSSPLGRGTSSTSPIWSRRVAGCGGPDGSTMPTTGRSSTAGATASARWSAPTTARVAWRWRRDRAGWRSRR